MPKIHQRALQHKLDSVADFNQPTHWQTSAEYHPKTAMFENSLKMYQNKLSCNFQWIFFVKLLWHCRLNLFCYKNRSKKTTTSNVKGFLILRCFLAIIPFFLPPQQRRSRFSSGCPRQEFTYYIHINYRTMLSTPDQFETVIIP